MSDWVEDYENLQMQAWLADDQAALALNLSAAKLADAHQDIERAFDSRLMALENTTECGAVDQAMVLMAWLLAHLDNPDHDLPAYSVIWKYKWVLSWLEEYDKISLEQLEASLEDYKQRCLDLGYGLKSYWGIIEDYAESIGDRKRSKEAFKQWKALDFDSMSDCRACTRWSEAMHFATRGKHQKAFDLTKKIRSGEESCKRFPRAIYSGLIESAMFLGKWELAAKYCKKGYSKYRDTSAYMATHALFMQYLTCVGRYKRALKLFQRHLPAYEDQNQTPYDRLLWCARSLSLFDALKRSGKKKLELKLPKDFALYTKKDKYRLDDLIEYYQSVLGGLCDRFDSRNGNNAVSKYAKQLRNLHKKLSPPSS